MISFAVTPAEKSWRKTLIAFCLVVIAGFLASSVTAAPSTTSSNRFLFIVDTSSAMKKWDEPARDAIFDLLYSGVRGYMTNGDSYGVWLAAETNNTSASVEVWRHKFATELASRTALRVKDAGCKGRPALDSAIADATRVAAAVGDVTVILISNAETPLRGTPFDAEINAAWAGMKPAMKSAKATINTALVARDGKFLAWAINSPEYLISIPILPPREKPIVAAPVVATPPAESPAPAPAPAVKRAPAPVKVASKPIVITRDTVDREKEAMRALASTVDGANVASAVVPAPANTVTSTAPVAPAVPVVAAPTPTPAPVPSLAQPVAPVKATTHVASATNVAPAAPPSAVSPPPSESPAVAVESKEPAKTTLPPPAKTSAESPPPAVGWWIGGAGAALVLVLGVVLLLRRNRPPAQSLVTEAIALERLYKPRS